jgi:hypothetical protein
LDTDVKVQCFGNSSLLTLHRAYEQRSCCSTEDHSSS